MEFVTTLLAAFPELEPVADREEALSTGRVWELAGGMHVPDPHTNQFTEILRWHGVGEFERQHYELQLDQGRMTTVGPHAILFIRFTELHRGPSNQATVKLRSDNHDDGEYFIRFAGKAERRESIRRSIESAVALGLPVRLSGSQIYFGSLGGSSLHDRLLRVGHVVAAGL